ncbi:MAG: nitrate- and nitrite sensing domain-containing protein, partial [Gallionellaceae bacterium]|nr:nitrate- and nitrite sensing domain-containing protein [Gallionellaceae bacterium]
MIANLKTRTRLIVMASIPTLALLYFSVYGTLEKATVAADMAKLESLVDVSVKIGALTHELQKERGMSAGFIVSKGAGFAADLPGQRTETDKKADALRLILKDFDLAQYDDSLKTTLNNAQASLADIVARRSDISALRAEAPESAAYYTKAISTYLSVPSMVSMLSTHSGISRLASAYASLLAVKERAGRERAMLSSVLTAGKFTADSLNKFLINSSAQDTYGDIFLSHAQDSQKIFYKSKMADQSVEEVERIKKTVMDNAGAPKLGIEPTYWFKVATDRINLLKEVEDRLSGDLLGSAENLRSEARGMMVVFITLTIFSILATFIFAFFLIRNLLKQLGGEPEYAAASVHKIAGGDLTLNLDVKAGDTSSMMHSLQVMQESLRKIIAGIKQSVDLIDTSSREISQGSIDLSVRTEEQAASLEETAASMEQLTSIVKQNAGNARQANQLARGASEIAARGGAVVDQVVGTMSSINESSRKIVD